MEPSDFEKTWGHLTPRGPTRCDPSCKITIQIDRKTLRATTTCSKHGPYPSGTYDPSVPKISDGTYTITLERGTPNVITCTNAPAENEPGSWTADDNLPDEG